jgi:hypothetical protein
MNDRRQALTAATAKRGAAYRDAIVGLALALLTGPQALAQIGPVETRGYLEYRYVYQASSDREGTGAHGAALRTDLSTYVWRPWILSARGSLLVQETGTDSPDGVITSSVLQGGLWLDFLARSKYPLTLFYEDFDADYDSQPFRRTARTRSHGFRQQLSSKRLGTYSVEFRRGMTDSLYADGFTLPTRNDNQRWEFKGRKVIGRNNFSVNSRSLGADAQQPDIRTDSLRHTVRHNFRAGTRFNLQNTFFVTDEQFDSEFMQSDRVYQQLYSLATWRPDRANRWLITGRGLFQENESASMAGGSMQSSTSLSGTASFRVTDRISLTGALGAVRMQSETTGETTAGYQQLGANYASIGHPLWGGTYQYSGRVSYGNRSEDGTLESNDLQDLKFDVGHSLSRVFETRGGKRIDIRGIQRVTTSHNSASAELNVLRNTVYVTSARTEPQMSRYLRFALTDQRSFGDEERGFQLVDLQYSLQGNLTRDSNWNLNTTVQYGLRNQTKPPNLVNESKSLSYSISAAYRRANLFDVPLLNFSSDFQLQSEDFQSEDPFDPDFDVDRQRVSSSWRNRLDYRVGMLHVQGDLGLHEVQGKWFASFRLTARRYFGMR